MQNKITHLAPNEVFVFGSNLLGIHGKGAAKDALKFGAKTGVGIGWHGQTYAIPTKYSPKESMPLYEIQPYINEFVVIAMANKNIKFLVTAIGCGNAGYSPDKIAPMFYKACKLENIKLPNEFLEELRLQNII